MFGPTAVYPMSHVTSACACIVENDMTTSSTTIAEPSHPIFVLDWDDTLLPNTYLSKMGFFDKEEDQAMINEEVQMELEKLSDQVVLFLTTCLSFGTCYVVTNGAKGWVERSCAQFLPRVMPFIEEMEIISARDKYESVFPNTPVEWKIAVFKGLLNSDGIDSHKRQVFAFGDSSIDRNAIHYVAKRTPHMLLKSIKFVENPTLAQLQKQLSLICNFLPNLSTVQDSLDLVLSTSMLE